MPILKLRHILPPALLLAATGPLAAQSDLNVPAGSLLVNESGSYQNVTVGSGATLKTIDANSGGAGDHAIAITLAAVGAGTIQNDGVIQLAGNDQGNTTVFANPVTLSGRGTLQLFNTTRFNDAIVQGPGTVTQAAGHTLVGGGGNTGDPGPSFSTPLVNFGLVTTSSLGFVLDGASLVNRGTFSATGGANLSLRAPTLDNTNGTVTAAAGSLVILRGVTITGGTLSSVNDTGSDFDHGGFFLMDSPATLNKVTLTAGSAFKVGNPLTLAGTLTNNGYFFLEGYNFNTGLTGGFTLAADATLAGTGTARLAGGQINATNGATLTVAAGANLFGGPGTINASVTNNGIVESVYQTLTINSPSFVNNGAVIVDDGGNLQIASSAGFTNFRPTAGPISRAKGSSPRGVTADGVLTGGSYALYDKGHGASLDFSGRTVKTNAAAVTLSGPNTNFPALNAMTRNEGSLTLLAQSQFNAAGNLDNEGTVTIDAGSALHVPGNYTAGDGSTLAITVGGTDASGAHSPGVLQVGNNARLGGTLAVAVSPGTPLPRPGDSLPVISVSKSVSGAFRNAAEGARVRSSDGRASFVVTHDPNTGMIVLGNFAPETPVTTPAFFNGQAALGNGVYYLQFPNGNPFGYYSFLSDPHYLYHQDLGYEYVFDAQDSGNGVYLYDFKSGGFFYTSPGFPFPYLYDFSLNSTVYYYPDPNQPGRYNTNGTRYFYVFNTGQIISK